MQQATALTAINSVTPDIMFAYDAAYLHSGETEMEDGEENGKRIVKIMGIVRRNYATGTSVYGANTLTRENLAVALTQATTKFEQEALLTYIGDVVLYSKAS